MESFSFFMNEYEYKTRYWNLPQVEVKKALTTTL
ncbi:hypothetical protein Bcell_1739 [Evansella cellulosilytica DSM 2522]|uniref:Uncharacterized protein n=1 Tax=Evansella cellulosilytica (strain ATCC 21833 / DSM 2522 / FERM P-1141 / JCM 9156 / N-4) TaxID=649639 RepID=E6TXS6_EVAC2|nr:hypothetical protein Bcell_1739 [Evansella cellulosilytica DSM 2522]